MIISIAAPLNAAQEVRQWRRWWWGRGVSRGRGRCRCTGAAVPDEFLQHLSPLGWERIILTGEYRWDLQQTSFPGERIGTAVG